MTNEFKKLTNQNETRYILEMTSGGTGSAAVAGNGAVPTNSIGELHRRLQELKKQVVSVPASNTAPRKGPLAPQTGAGQHRDKKKEQKAGQEKHKKPFYENEPDHEISMASSELTSIAKDAANLLDMVRQRSEEEGLEAWQQSKITKAADFMNSVLQSISGDEEQGVAEGNDAYDPLDPKNPANTTPGMTKKDIIKRRVGQDERGDTRVRAGQPRSTHLRNIPHLPEQGVAERYDEWDEADMWYRFDYDSGTLRQKSWRHAQSREARANGWRESHEAALRDAGIIKSKFKPGKFVQNVGGKWVEVNPYGQPSSPTPNPEQGVAEGTNEVTSVMQQIVVGELELYDVMNNPQGDAQTQASRELHNMYERIASEQGLHPDDDFEDIESYMIDELEDQYGFGDEVREGVVGPKSCWPGHRKVGTQPGTGKNKGKRVNDCEKIGEDAYINKLNTMLNSKVK